VELSRIWRSPSAEVDFRDAGQHQGGGKVEPAAMRGEGGVVILATDRRGDAAPTQSKLVADTVTGAFGPDSALTAMTGTGHASMEQTSAAGTHEAAAGDQVEAHFAQAGAGAATAKSGAAAAQIESAMLDGHVTLAQQPAPKPGAQPQAEMRATAAHAVYENEGQWLHLTGNPRVVDGGLEMTADKIDVTQDSGNAFAHGNVKATWINTNNQANGQPGAKQAGVTLGGQGPAHAVADEAQLQQGQAVFSGNARLWQEASSVVAPTIAIDRQKQTLTAQSGDRANPVRAVLASAGKAPGTAKSDMGKQRGSAVIRVRGGDLWYSDAERKAVMHGGTLGAVTAATAMATTVSDSVELELTPAGGHETGQTQVERMTAAGHVTVSSQGRRGTGQQLVYTEADGNYVLTGAPGEPPKLTDPSRGTVTGQALIFHSRDDSVSIEGGPEETQTLTTAPK
jgi:lipopolysaccharide export system protein LptA